MTQIDEFKQDITKKRDVIISVFNKHGFVDYQPTFDTLAIIQEQHPDVYVEILSEMYGEEFDRWYNTANADGKGAERVIKSVSGFFATLMSPLTGLNEAIGNLGGGNSTNEQSLETLNNALYEYETKIQQYRTFALIGIAVCLIVGLILIFK